MLHKSCAPRAGEFMLSRYQEVVEIVLRYKASRERLIKRTVVALLPLLAAYSPERFAQQHLPEVTAFFLSILPLPSERGPGEPDQAMPVTSLAGKVDSTPGEAQSSFPFAEEIAAAI